MVTRKNALALFVFVLALYLERVEVQGGGEGV